MTPKPLPAVQDINYEKEAQAYLRSLPLEHFREAPPQATQRKITLESLDLVTANRPEVQVFNELLVQYPRPGRSKPGKVVPDNMVVLATNKIEPQTSYNLPLEPAPPFWVLEYVSRRSQRKDYKESFRKYERELKVPYYLVFYPDDQKLALFHHTGRIYIPVEPNEQGRFPIPELNLEMGLLGGWVRYWYKGELLDLPADLRADRDLAREQRAEEKRRADQEKARADEEKRRADQEQARADDEKARADELQKRLEAAERLFPELRRPLEPPG
jgi:Uma2 family endonuclease